MAVTALVYWPLGVVAFSVYELSIEWHGSWWYLAGVVLLRVFVSMMLYDLEYAISKWGYAPLRIGIELLHACFLIACACFLPIDNVGIPDAIRLIADFETGWCTIVALRAGLGTYGFHDAMAPGAATQLDRYGIAAAVCVFVWLRWAMTRRTCTTAECLDKRE